MSGERVAQTSPYRVPLDGASMSSFSRLSILAIPFLAVAPLGLLACDAHGKELTFGKSEVSKEPVTEAQAKKLGEVLKTEIAYLNDTDERSAQVIEDGPPRPWIAVERGRDG